MTRITEEGIRQPIDVVVTWDDMAYAFAKATSKSQQEFLLALGKHVTHTKPNASWAFQCHAIANEPEWLGDSKLIVTAMLETLIEHLIEQPNGGADV